MLSGVKVLVQVICTKCPERAEFRSVVAKAVVDIMDKLPVTLYASVVEWIKKVGTVDRYCELRNFCIGSYFTAVGLTRKILSNGLLSMLLEPTAITGIIQESGFVRKDSTEFPVLSQPTEICGN
ncbi:uncharacterized protein LOC141877392 isoform X4 [Acropora palmata]|uniref:uncharacterized protein LOC141877392 isoform X4 n=1 Tax=Acropora palmata TaxID=6131 RepID=UPI003DA176F6